MLIINRKANPTMIELVIGIVLYGVLGVLLISCLILAGVPFERLFEDSAADILIGFLAGIVFCTVMTVHMAMTVETALERGEQGALKHTRISYIIRMVCLVAVFALMLIFKIGNIFAMLFGLLSLKLSAYIQPVTHKLREKLKKGR